MNIGFFTETYYPTPDGVSHYLKDVKNQLEKKGHTVYVFTLTGDSTEKNVFKPLTIPLFLYQQYRTPVSIFPFNLYRKMLKTKLDIVNIHGSFFMGTLGYRIARAKKIPIIATFHTDFAKMKESISMPMKDTFFWISWRYNLFLYRRCSTVICPSGPTAEVMRENGMKNVHELSLFVDIEKYSPCERKPVSRTIQYIGRLTKDKRIDKILDLASHMKKDDGVVFSIAGVGPEEYSIKKRIESIGLEDRVRMAGYVDEKAKLSALDDSYLFIHPSESDTFGIAVLEALAKGKPALVSRNFPLLTFCQGDCGMIPVDFNDINATAKAIRDIIADDSRYEYLSRKAVDFVRSNFNPELHAEKLLEIYRKYTGETGKSA